MMAELIDRKRMKAEVRDLLSAAQVSPKAMTAVYMGLLVVFDLVDELGGGAGVLSLFLEVLTLLLSLVLGAGFILYCMAVRRGERAEFLTLFDGFSFVGKIILLELVMALFVFLWSLLLIVPGIVALYRYQFALYNLCENPDIGVLEALELSKRQTMGYKSQLFMLDLSYLGWIILAGLPSTVAAFVMNRAAAEMVLNGTFGYMTTEQIWAAVMPVSSLSWTLVVGVWSLLAGLFYISNRACVTLGYFETAKRTSGFGASPRLEDDGWNSPWGNQG